MDTSETYIKMCEKAEEIQALFQYKRLDFYFRNDRDKRRKRLSVSQGHGRRIQAVLWMPCQDQLQEMVGGLEAGFIDWAGWLKNIYPCEKYPNAALYAFDSYEQLWLAFVMKELHNKVWNGEDWVKVKDD